IVHSKATAHRGLAIAQKVETESKARRQVQFSDIEYGLAPRGVYARGDDSVIRHVNAIRQLLRRGYVCQIPSTWVDGRSRTELIELGQEVGEEIVLVDLRSEVAVPNSVRKAEAMRDMPLILGIGLIVPVAQMLHGVIHAFAIGIGEVGQHIGHVVTS